MKRAFTGFNIEVNMTYEKNSKSIVDIGRRLNKLESGKFSVNKLCREAEERKRRESYLVGFNIRESDKLTGQEREMADN